MLPDVYYKPRPFSEQILSFGAGFQHIDHLALVKEAGGTVVRGGGGWTSVENYDTKALALGKKQEEAIAWCGENGIAPMAVAAYGPPFKTVADLTVATDVPVGATLIPIHGAWPLKVGFDFVTHKGVKAINFTKHGSYYGSLVLDNGAQLKLAAKTSKELKKGDVLSIHRLAYSPPAGRDRNQTSIQAYKRYAVFLAQELHRLAGCGYVCLWNEPEWIMDPWVPGLVAFYEGLTPAQREEIGSGGMHTILAAFFGLTLPAGVRMVSGATDKCGADCAILHQYMADVVGNRGANYIPMPLPGALSGWLIAEGVHPGAGLREPEAQAWDDSFAVLNPAEKGSNLHTMRQRQAMWGVSHGYNIAMFATEAGGTGETHDEVLAARHILRRVVSLWSCGVKLASPGLAAVTDEQDDGRLTPKPSYEGLKRLGQLKIALGEGGKASDCPIVLGASPGQMQTYPLMALPFFGVNGAVTIVYQRSFSDSKEPGHNWYDLAPCAPMRVRVKNGAKPIREAANLRDGTLLELTETESGVFELWSVSDDPIAVLA